MKSPKAKTPKMKTPKVETPKMKTLKVETPKIKTSKVATPKTETKVDTPKIKTPKFESPKLKTPKVENLKMITSKRKVETLKKKIPEVATLKLKPEAKSATPEVITSKQNLKNGRNNKMDMEIPKHEEESQILSLINSTKKRKYVSSQEKNIYEELPKNKKTKFNNKLNQKHPKIGRSSPRQMFGDLIKVSFPPGAKCYKNVLEQVVNLSNKVTGVSSLIVRFKNLEEVNKKLPLLKKFAGFKPMEKVFEPLKKYAFIANTKVADPADLHKMAKSVSFKQLYNSKAKAMVKGSYVFAFANEKDAAAAEKVFVLNGNRIKLRPYIQTPYHREKPVSENQEKSKHSENPSKAEVTNDDEESNDDGDEENDDEDQENDNEDEENDNEDQEKDNEDEENDDEDDENDDEDDENDDEDQEKDDEEEEKVNEEEMDSDEDDDEKSEDDDEKSEDSSD